MIAKKTFGSDMLSYECTILIKRVLQNLKFSHRCRCKFKSSQKTYFAVRSMFSHLKGVYTYVYRANFNVIMVGEMGTQNKVRPLIFGRLYWYNGAWGGVLVKALRY
jgi:hypothetical protein